MLRVTLARTRAMRKELERKVRESGTIVVLLGAAGRGLVERRELRHALSNRGLLALVPEDDFPRDISASIVERAMLSKGDIDLAFVNMESWGTATEFGQFHEVGRIARKLRVLVAPEYHPFHGNSSSYLTDLYLSHLAVFGHVYPVTRNRSSSFPSPRKAVTKLSVRYSEWKALRGPVSTR